MNHKAEFINKLKSSAIKGWKDYNILPSLTISQAILETGWGSKSIGNNIFGIKADNLWKGKKQLVETSEYYNVEKVLITAWFRDYDNIYESIEDRYKFLQADRYKKIIGEKDYRKVCEEIFKAGYATDINYTTKLINIIEDNNLHEIDNIAFKEDNTANSIKNEIENIYNNRTVSSWANESWEYCKVNKLIDGTRPKDYTTRDELITTLERFVKLWKKN